MKTKIKRTGEIIDVLDYDIVDGDIHAYLNAHNDVIHPSYPLNFYKDLELIVEFKEIDWEQRRYEIAKEMLPAVKDIKRHDDNGNLRKLNRNEAAYEAVKYADALIAELHKGGGE